MPLSKRMTLIFRQRTSILSKVYLWVSSPWPYTSSRSYFCFSDLIQGKDRHPENKEKIFLFQIVANKINGVDVDK